LGRKRHIANKSLLNLMKLNYLPNLTIHIDMLPPNNDLDDRKKIWDFMQNFWMDTDPTILLPKVIEVCAKSKYSIDELEAIYWNEVRPAVSFNLLLFPAPEWAGFEIEWLSKRIIQKNRFGKRLPIKLIHAYSNFWWKRLQNGIKNARELGYGPIQ